MKSVLRWPALTAAIAAAGVVVALVSPNDTVHPTLSSCRVTARNVTELQWCAHAVYDSAQRDLQAAVLRPDSAAIQADVLIEANAIALAAGRVSDPATIAKQWGISGGGSRAFIYLKQVPR